MEEKCRICAKQFLCNDKDKCKQIKFSHLKSLGEVTYNDRLNNDK